LVFWLLFLPAAGFPQSEEAARKVLAARCWACHAQTASGGLRLDSREAMLQGGKTGPAVVPGDPDHSRVYRAILRVGANIKPMPPQASLTPKEQQTIAQWIREGSPWSDSGDHWSFRPLRSVARGESIDSRVADALQSAGLRPNPRADRRTLIRRAHFDLIGLPPTEEQFEAAFNDPSSDWFSKMVSRLLDLPQFGEKWARHWLDVARYGEDDFTGTAVVPYSNAWRYRDWVVQALNDNLPYDRFLMAQLAGDLMNDRSLLPATGLLGLGPWYYGIAQPPQSRADERNDRVDVVTRGMLGVTLACARCHDHKYDPFTARDYYALAGVFASTAYKEYPLVLEAEAEEWKRRRKEVDDAEKALNAYLDELAARVAESFSHHIPVYMMATVDARMGNDLQPKVLKRWQTYLSKPEDQHPYLRKWFDGNHTLEEAQSFQRLLQQIVTEKKQLDDENKSLIEAEKRTQPKVARTIVLPGGYRSEEDFNPGAYIPSKSLDRDRFVAWNRIFGDKSAPLKFDRELAAELMDAEARTEYEGLKARYEELKTALPPQYAYLQGVSDFEPHDLNLNLRGDPEALGDLVPRRFPTALSGGRLIPLNDGSGRLQLADAVAHHPLAARVAVNRVWLTLFGNGLVRTPSNFGSVGDRPVAPELLEYVAARFVQQGYSVKAIVREILLSEAWQRSSMTNEANLKVDPDNRYLWSQNRRRLQAEPLRDAMLAVSGELDLTLGGESKASSAEFRRRTLYAKMSRFQQDETLSLFDLPAASVTCEQRTVTNVPLQMLFYLNSDVVTARARALGERISSRDLNQGINVAYRLLFNRMPTGREQQLGREFLTTATDDGWKQYARVLLSSNEFAYVD
jgi:cytochrome c553